MIYQKMLIVKWQKARNCKTHTCEIFDAARELLCTGEFDCETMRIAYVAMTRPRKYLAVAIAKPSNTIVLNARFPQAQWEYVFVD